MRNWLILILLLLFILQGTVVGWLVPAVWQGSVIVAPQLVLVAIIYIGLYGDRRLALFLGLGFGLLHDVTYAWPMLGTYTFTYALIGYLAGLAALRPNSGIFPGLVVIATGDLLFKWIIYGLYRLFQITHTGVHWAFFHLMLPSLLIDLLFALAVYVPMRKLLEPLAVKNEVDKE